MPDTHDTNTPRARPNAHITTHIRTNGCADAIGTAPPTPDPTAPGDAEVQEAIIVIASAVEETSKILDLLKGAVGICISP